MTDHKIIRTLGLSCSQFAVKKKAVLATTAIPPNAGNDHNRPRREKNTQQDSEEACGGDWGWHWKASSRTSSIASRTRRYATSLEGEQGFATAIAERHVILATFAS